MAMADLTVYGEYLLYIERMVEAITGSVSIQYDEYTGEGLQRNQDYDSIRHYLSSLSISHARTWEASESSNTGSMVFCIDDDEEVEDLFQGVKVKWSLSVDQNERRYFTLTFGKRHREMIVERYVDLVLGKGKEIRLRRNRERKLYYIDNANWGNVPFHHPATFEKLAMDPVKKEEIKKDLIRFSQEKDYCREVGKPWKRSYLLFGPPGTGKSTMIYAMANFLEYDVYDLDITSVKDNSELEKLLLDTTSKSVIVTKDIDCCSLAFTGQEREKKEEKGNKEVDKNKEAEEEKKLTLSGLLNAIDGLWSACNDEKIIVFKTDKLDPALIRRGGMDSHIEMSYCRFEAFKILAKNYLRIEAHDMFGEIDRLLEETDMSPADVAENLTPKYNEADADICLKRLVKSLEEEKEKARKFAEEEEKKKAEEETIGGRKQRKNDCPPLQYLSL